VSKNCSNVVVLSPSGTVYSRNIPTTESNQNEAPTEELEEQPNPTRNKKAPLKYNDYVTSF
jgi:hypothetical protein